MDERKIIARLKKGDSMALALLIEKYTPYLHALSSNIMGGLVPEEDREEIVSESFISLWYNRDKIRPGKLKAYLTAIARSKAISRLRALKIYEPLEDDLLVSECREAEYALLCAEMAAVVRGAVNSLPEPDREIFKRHYFLYGKTERIAEVLDMNPATVRTKLARGRRRLKNYLTERGYLSEDLFD